MTKDKIDPNAKIALNQMKIEIANELGIANNFSENKGNLTSGKNVFMGGYVGGNMTKRLVKMGEKQLLKNDSSQPKNVK